MAHPKEIGRLLGRRVSYRPALGQPSIEVILIRRSKKDEDACVGMIPGTDKEIPFSAADVIVRGSKITNVGKNRI